MRAPCPQCKHINRHAKDRAGRIVKRFLPQQDTTDPLIYARADIVLMVCRNTGCQVDTYLHEVSYPLKKPEVKGDFIKTPDVHRESHETWSRWDMAITNNPSKGSKYEAHLSQFTKNISWCAPSYILNRYFRNLSPANGQPSVLIGRSTQCV